MDKPREDMKEHRVKARLAWNGWPDTPESRKIIADHEARDPISACAWDRVISALTLHGLENVTRDMPSLPPNQLKWRK